MLNDALKKQIFERDGNRCQNCGKEANIIHHIFPEKRGGKNEPDNLIALCNKCHEMVHQFGNISIGFWIRIFKDLIKEKNEHIQKESEKNRKISEF